MTMLVEWGMRCFYILWVLEVTGLIPEGMFTTWLPEG